MHTEQFNASQIKQTVKRLADKGRYHQATISRLRRARPAPNPQAHGQLIHAAVQAKHGFRFCSRYHQLALAFVRGRPYRQVERRTRPDNKPLAATLLNVLSEFSCAPLATTDVIVGYPKDLPAAVVAYLSLLREWLAEPQVAELERAA